MEILKSCKAEQHGTAGNMTVETVCGGNTKQALIGSFQKVDYCQCGIKLPNNNRITSDSCVDNCQEQLIQSIVYVCIGS